MSDLDALPEEEVVERAKSLGWKEPEEWKGEPPPGGLVDARTYLKKADDALPVLRANNEKLHSEIAAMKRDMQAVRQIYEQNIVKTEREAFNRARAEVLEQQKQAIRDGDADAFEAAENRKAEIARQEAAFIAPKPVQVDVTAIQQAWEANNKWFREDFILHETAEKAAKFLAQSKPNLSAEAFLDEMKNLVMKQHPDHEAFAGRSMPSYDTGDRQVSNPRTRGRQSYEAIPSEERATYDRYIRQGMITKEEAIKHHYGL